MKNDALTGAPWLLAVARVFERAGEPVYLVGGAVRNPLMGLPLSDVDVCGPARPERVMALCEGTEVRAVLRAAHFGTVELHVTDADGARHMAEYTTFREDSYRCGHRPDAVRFTTDISVDALRRDFSVNALYRRLHDGALGPVIDPTGGRRHLEQGVLHTVTPDPDRVLRDDGLRILRAARFQAELDLAPTPALLDSLTRHAPLLRDIACERLRDEWQKILLADLRYPMLKRRAPATASGLKTLRDCGVWPYLLDAPYGEEAVAALAALDWENAPLAGRLALLLRGMEPSDLQSALLRLRFSNRDAALAARYAAALRCAYADAFETVKLGRDAVAYAAAAFHALGDTAGEARAAGALDTLRDAPWSLRELAVGGDELMPLLAARAVPARQMGRLLEALWRMAAEGQTANETAALLGAAEEWLNRME